jgi:dipeptidyl aminopeptidase/acylaminoacyl peptidase
LWALSWSPDGTILIYGGLTPTGYDITSLQVSGTGKSHVFLHTPYTESLAALSPDGRWLAYSSNETGREEVYVEAFPGLGGKWLISTEGGTRPVWSRNGDELFYRNNDKLLLVPVGTKLSFSVGTPRVLFETPYVHAGRDYGVSYDKGRFLFIKEGEQVSAPTQINVVLNWSDELKQRVPSGPKP